MINWQIAESNRIEKVNTIENLVDVDSIKVKVTKCLITRSDIGAFLGESKVKFPITPCSIAVGQITETLQESNYFSKGDKVFLHPDLTKDGSLVQNGLLKEFAVIDKSNCFILPKQVSENTALFLKHISLALSVIDKLNVEKGEYVAIIGGSILANITAQLLNYYKAVPILIDSDEENLNIARQTDVYYALNLDKRTETEVKEITGGRMCNKVIYVSDDDLNVDNVIKLSAQNAKVAITGIADVKQKLNLSQAFQKQLSIRFIKKSDENYETSINLLVLKALNLNYFKLTENNSDGIQRQFDNAVKKIENGEKNVEFIINLMEL